MILDLWEQVDLEDHLLQLKYMMMAIHNGSLLRFPRSAFMVDILGSANVPRYKVGNQNAYYCRDHNVDRIESEEPNTEVFVQGIEIANHIMIDENFDQSEVVDQMTKLFCDQEQQIMLQLLMYCLPKQHIGLKFGSLTFRNKSIKILEDKLAPPCYMIISGDDVDYFKNVLYGTNLRTVKVIKCKYVPRGSMFLLPQSDGCGVLSERQSMTALPTVGSGWNEGNEGIVFFREVSYIICYGENAGWFCD
ncbi:hypothetical protein LCGC14_0870820 [marine sediment metagenome]|uniref:Uncharacterized protein n=1 Tax=marine sediment metagenome TaxID=412755 RepID=A0A0F9SBS4_9ZZZZ